MKKLLAVAVALVMAMALSVSVLADFTMTVTSGQDFEGKVLADGVELSGDWYSDKLSTSWVAGGTDFAAILEALKVDGSVLTLTYKGEISAIGFQSSVGEIKATDLTVTTDGDVSTATVPGASLLADPFVLEGYDWCNLMVQATAGTVLTGFTVTTGESAAAPTDEAPADEAPADEAPADEAPADEAPADTAEAPETGLALAVIPAVIALAAVAVSKKH